MGTIAKQRETNRRQALLKLAHTAAGFGTLRALAGGATGLATLLSAMPSPLAAAAATANRGQPRLKITDVKVFKTQIGNGSFFTNAKIYTSEPGLTGIGCGGHSERQSIVAHTIETYLKPAIVGRYADEIEDIWQMAWNSAYWRASVDSNNAISAVDGALWDIMGKRAGMPVHNLLGGKLRPALPAFTGGGGRTMKELEDGVRKGMANGYNHFRISPVGGDGSGGGGGYTAQLGGDGPGQGGLGKPGFGERGPIYPTRGPGYVFMTNLIDSLDHLRKTVGFNVDLLTEVDFRLAAGEAIVFAKALEPFRMFWLEEPLAMEDIAYYSTLRQQCSVPFAFGELVTNQAEWLPLVQNRWIDFIRLHISACGGLTMANKVAKTCDFFGIRTAWHGPGNVSPVGTTVNVHIDFAAPNFGLMEGGVFSEQVRELFPGCPERRNGMTYSNDQPGLGIDINETLAAKYVPTQPGADRGVRCYDGSPCRP